MITSLAAKIGSHPRRTLVAVFLFVLAAGAFGGPVAGALQSTGGFAPPGADSAVAIQEIEDATGRAATAGVVLVVSTPGGLDAAAQRVDDVAAELAAEEGIVDVVAPNPARAGPGLVSVDGDSALVLGTLSADADFEAVAESVLDRFDDADDVVVGGQAIAKFQIGSKVSEDLGRAETFALPLLIILSLIFFGGRAALMPLVVGATTVLGTFLALAGINQVYGLSVFALNLVIGLGLGLAIDYTLFLVTRYREELPAKDRRLVRSPPRWRRPAARSSTPRSRSRSP